LLKLSSLVRKNDKNTLDIFYKNLLYFFKNSVNAIIKRLLLKGLGLKVLSISRTFISFKLGFSHLIKIKIPFGLKIKIYKQKTNQKINIIENDKTIVGNFASFIKHLRKADSYKRKGIRYKNEFLKLKKVKTT
jgi:large subunit ribosomal protein L6